MLIILFTQVRVTWSPCLIYHDFVIAEGWATNVTDFFTDD